MLNKKLKYFEKINMTSSNLRITLQRLFNWKEVSKRKTLEIKKLKRQVKELELTKGKWEKKVEAQDKKIEVLKKKNLKEYKDINIP